MNSPSPQPRLRTPLPGPKSRALDERRRSAVSAGVSVSMPAYIDHSEGDLLVDVDGNRLIDMGSGIAVTSVGNPAPRVADAVAEQVGKLTHTCFMINPYEGYVALAEKLIEITPGDGAKRALLVNSGAEAVENAIKVARLATGRPAVVAFDHAYHGRTLLTLALTAKNMPYKQGFGPFAPEIYRVPMAYPLRWKGGPEACTEQAFDEFRTLIESEIGPQNLAAVIIEPIQGEGGFIVPPPGFLPALQQYCRDNGIVFIADEVQTGFARTGQMFACEDEGLEPDLVTMAKAMGGGMPIAAVVGRADLMDKVHPGGLGGTYGGNPVSCAGALAAIETIERDGLLARARQIGEAMTERLQALAKECDFIAEVRGRGAMVAVELAQPGSLEPDKAAVAAVLKYCHERGVIVLSAGTFGNVIRLLPPLIITDAHLDEALTVLEEAIRAAA